MKMSKEPELQGFEFQTITDQEAENLVLSASGKHAYLKNQILEKIEAENAPFVFGLPKGNHLDIADRKSISHAVNLMLTKSGKSWEMTYSVARHLFVVSRTNQNNGYAKYPKAKLEPRKKIPELSGDGRFSTEDIAAKASEIFGVPVQAIVTQRSHSLICNAISYVSRRTYANPIHKVAKFMGLKPGSINYQCAPKRQEASRVEIAALEKALKN